MKSTRLSCLSPIIFMQVHLVVSLIFITSLLLSSPTIASPSLLIHTSTSNTGTNTAIRISNDSISSKGMEMDDEYYYYENVKEYLKSIGMTLDDVCQYNHNHNYNYNSGRKVDVPRMLQQQHEDSNELTLTISNGSMKNTNNEKNDQKDDDEKNNKNDDDNDDNQNDNYHKNTNDDDDDPNENETESNNNYIQNAFLSILCVTIAAMAAGLTMGLLSQDLLDLKIKEMAAAKLEEREQAKTLIPLIQDHHRLLVTLLLMNALANEALPLFLDHLVPSYMAVILSVTLVLFFGEIIPSAIFTGPNQLYISSQLAPLVKIVLFVLAPIAWPIAKMLDWCLHQGDENGNRNGESGGHSGGAPGGLEKYDRKELSALVRLQFEHRKVKMMKKQEKAMIENTFSNDNGDLTTMTASIRLGHNHNTDCNNHNHTKVTRQTSESLREGNFVRVVDEVMMVEGALQMYSKQVIDVMQPWRDVYSIPKDLILNQRNIVEIYRSGHSRIPVYDTTCGKVEIEEGQEGDGDMTKKICGLLLVRQLAVVNSQDKRSLSTLPLAQPFIVEPSMNMIALLNLLQAGKGKMAIVCYRPEIATAALSNQETIPASAEVIGLVTLEDCIEELIQEEIYDEYDKREIIAYKRMKWVAGKWKAFVKRNKKARNEAEEGEIIVQQQIDVSEDEGVNETTSLLLHETL